MLKIYNGSWYAYPVQCIMTSTWTELPSRNTTVPSLWVLAICNKIFWLVLYLDVNLGLFLFHQEERVSTIEWSHMLSWPSCFLGGSSGRDLFEIWTSLAYLTISLEMSTALAALPIINTTCTRPEDSKLDQSN